MMIQPTYLGTSSVNTFKIYVYFKPWYADSSTAKKDDRNQNSSVNDRSYTHVDYFNFYNNEHTDMGFSFDPNSSRLDTLELARY